MRPPPAEPRWWAAGAVVAAAGLALYLATGSQNLALAHDSVYYINSIEAGRDLFHPHHLLYAGMARLWLDAWRAVAPRADAVLLVGALNAVFGALSLFAVFALLRRRFGLGAAAAACGAALAGLSFGFWFYSTCVEVYLPPLCFLLLTLYVLGGSPLGPARMARAGAAHALAVLFHQSNVLLLPVVLYALWRDARRRRGPWLGPALAYGVTLAGLVGVPYLAVLIGPLGARTPAAALAWLTSYAQHSEYWHRLSAETLFEAATGAWRATVGSHFAFAVPQLRVWLGSVFPGQLTSDEAYLVRGLAPGFAAALVALASGFVVATAAGLAWALARRPAAGPRREAPFGLVAGWIAVYAAFFIFWVPYNPEFWIPQVTGFWILFAAAWFAPRRAAAGRGPESGSRARLALPVGLAAALLVVNLAGSVWWTRARENDYYYVKTAPLGALTRPGDLVVFGRAWILQGYAERYGAARVLGLLEVHDATGAGGALADSVARAVELTRAAGGRVLVADDALRLEPRVARSLGPDALPVAELWQRYAGGWQTVGSAPAVYRRIDPAAPGR
jgi:hypothetical protein